MNSLQQCGFGGASKTDVLPGCDIQAAKSSEWQGMCLKLYGKPF